MFFGTRYMHDQITRIFCEKYVALTSYLRHVTQNRQWLNIIMLLEFYYSSMYFDNILHFSHCIFCFQRYKFCSDHPSICLFFLLVQEYQRVTPPPILVRSIQGEFRRYAVRKGSVRSRGPTQKFCYIVRIHQFLL